METSSNSIKRSKRSYSTEVKRAYLTGLLPASPLHSGSTLSLIIVITRHYNFFSQYVKELVALLLSFTTKYRTADVLDSNQWIPLCF